MSNTDQTIELKIADAMNIIIDISEAASVGEITGAQFNELAQEQYQALLQAVNEARIEAYKSIMQVASTAEMHRHAYDYSAMKLNELTPKEDN